MPQKNYSKFPTKTPDESYDHIIIGSGMGGMTLATFLAKAGKKVAIFERHYVPGGFTHAFKRKDGLQWDVGVHYMGNMDKSSGIRKIMDFLTGHQLEWESMGDIYDVIHIGEDTYEIPAGKENYRKKMKDYFPNDTQAIDQYLSLVDSANRRGGAFFMEKSFEPFLSHTIGRVIRSMYHQFSKKTTLEVLMTLTANRRLIAVLCGQCGNYGLPPAESSFAAHAMVVGHFMEGGYYPHGGSPQIGKNTLRTFAKLGGKTYISADVTSIVVKNNSVQGIQISDQFIACKSVISNIGVDNTFNHLLTKEQSIYCHFDLKKVKASSAHMCLYIGLDKTDKELNLPKYNIWNYATEIYANDLSQITPSNAPEKFAYISFPSAKDPEWATDHPVSSTIQAISVGRYEWFTEYENQPWLNREEAYQQIKTTFQEAMLKKLYKLLPQAEGHVIYTEVSTPLSTKHFSNYQHGEIYGLAHTPNRFNLPFLKPKTRIKGLRLVGQDITIVGVAGAMMSGMLCAITILKFGIWKVFRDMNKPVV
ncbi:NAD(P)/FAD-dependent oxidoreductase [Reichenbachiella agarivorans]|uniref:NAD(P)/FAD-dependent oxidoreductase n=1 Tax=Reichenbachiella agarivorans TaxID=2979464 RepID=A0ABY6CPH5_9BACT|nr:NAD(P)/FAD-dependent oxidoreductase [Reichenbachiella agarivorans]UXP31664.1 NAD(P)/FAD-dependent oxidoreductase [Reichenbachiella agarivorans]